MSGQAEIDEQFFAIVTNLVGAPTGLPSDDSSVAGRARRSLWGRTTWAGESTPLLFPGQYLDNESGLAYNLHRYYDPDTARYVSEDPLGLAPAPNPAKYVHNPHTWADPLGLNPCAQQPQSSNGPSGPSSAAPGPSAQEAFPPSPERVNLASEQRTQHILHGDNLGGGLMAPAKPGKSESQSTGLLTRSCTMFQILPQIRALESSRRRVRTGLSTRRQVPRRAFSSIKAERGPDACCHGTGGRRYHYWPPDSLVKVKMTDPVLLAGLIERLRDIIDADTWDFMDSYNRALPELGCS